MARKKAAAGSAEGPKKKKKYPPDNVSRFVAFGERLSASIAQKASRRGGTYTAADLARELVPKMLETPVRTTGTDSSTISLWRKNGQRPTLEKIVLIAECLDVKPGWLAFGEAAHKGDWPVWIESVWPDGIIPGEREARYRKRTDNKLRPFEKPKPDVPRPGDGKRPGRKSGNNDEKSA